MGARILIVDDSPTIRKVVASILERRDYEVAVAGDGVEALAHLGSHPVDLVLVDFVMPRMNGYQFCRALRQKQIATPVVLMSAKGDKIRGKFVEQTGALDAITKPFDARGLVAVIESALLKGAANKEAGADAARESDGLGRDAELGHDLSVDSMVAPSNPSALAAHALAEVLLPSLLGPLDGTVSEEQLRKALAAALTAQTVGELGSVLRSVDFGQGAGEVLAGDLSVISISEILQVLDMQRQTGALTVATRKSQIILFVRDGALDFATYSGLPEEFLLGRYLVDGRAVAREVLDAALRRRSASDGRVLGDYLVAEGVITPGALRAALEQQTSELLFEVVRWRKGRFRFLHGAANEIADRAQLGLPTAGLIMEGFRRVDEWRLIEDSFDFNDVLFRDELAIEKLLEQDKLTPQERLVLEHIDGESQVREVVDTVGGSSFAVCKILYQLLNSRLVRRRSA